MWVGVHFGSQGLGHGIATWALKAGGARDGMDVVPLVLEAGSELGSEYLAAMHLAGRYAYAGRDRVCDRVVRILGARKLDEVHNHHNFAWKETHDGQEVWVVRKGATPAFPGQRGFVGGSMGDDAVILRGDRPGRQPARRGRQPGEGALLDRARRRRGDEPDGGPGQAPQGRPQLGRRPKRPGLISRRDMEGWIAKRGVVLRGADTDEAPQAYRSGCRRCSGTMPARSVPAHAVTDRGGDGRRGGVRPYKDPDPRRTGKEA